MSGKGCLPEKSRNKRSRPAFYPFPGEFQVLLQIIGNSGEVHHLVGLCQAKGIDLSKSHELGQRAENRFHRALPLAFHVPALWTVDPCNVPFILRPIIGNTELLLLGTLAQTLFAYRATCTNMLPCTVLLLPGLGAAVQKLLGERYHLTLRTYIMVLLFVIDEIIGAALVGPVGRDETFQPHFLQKGIVLPAAIARVRHAVLPDQALFP